MERVLQYDYSDTLLVLQGTCKYMLAKDCHSKQFAIYVQNFDRYNMPGAWTKSVTLLIGDTKIGLRKNGKVIIVGSYSILYCRG